MRRWSWQELRVLFLVLALGVGAGLSSGQTCAMPAQMALAAGTSGSGSAACHGEDRDADGGAGAISCLSACAPLVQALLPDEPADLPRPFGTAFESGHVFVTGHSSKPDHGPPKPLVLG